MTELDVVVAEEDLLLAQPRDIAVDASGRIFVLDGQDQHIVVVAPSGQLETTIGSPGSGPGEFSRSIELGIVSGRVHVFDFGRRVVQEFQVDGTHVRERGVDISGLPLGVVFAEGALVYTSSSLPARGGLAAIVGHDGVERLIGDPVVSGAALAGDFLEEVHAREMPGFMRNGARPIPSANGSLWLFLHADPELRLYGPEGELRRSFSVDVPETEAIREAFFDWYSEIDANDALRYFTMVADGIELSGRLWLLWDTPPGDQGLVTIHDASGQLEHRIVFPPLRAKGTNAFSRRQFAVDSEAGRVYLIASDASQLWALDVPEGFGS